MRPSRDSKVIVSSIIYYRYSPSHQQRRAPRRLAGSRSTAGTARGEGGGAAAEGGGRRLAEPGRRLTSRLLPARTANRGSFPFVSWPRRQGGPRLAHRRLCPRTAPPPLPAPLCEAAAETAAVAARLHRWCPRWARGIKLKLRRASLRWWAGEFGGAGARASLPRVPLASLGSDQQQVRRRGTREPGGQGMHVPSVAAAGERRAGRALRFLQTPREAPENKVLREPGQSRGYAEPGNAARSALSRRRPAGSACLSQYLPARLGTARLGSRARSSRRGSRSPRPAHSPRPVPPRELGLQARGAGAELSKAEAAPPPLARGRAGRSGRFRRTEGEKRGASALWVR